MSFKSILTVATRKEDAAALDGAISLARSQDAHLDVLCLGIDHTHSGYYYVGGMPVAPMVHEEALKEARSDALEVEEAVRQRLKAEEIRWAVEGAVAQIGVVGAHVGQLARFCDLVVVTRPEGKDTMADSALVAEAALFDGKVPVLLMPTGQQKVEGQRIVIGWNQSDAAMSAIRAALPLLKKAAHVDVAIIAPDSHSAERSDPGGPLSQFLARHGVKAEVSVLARTLPRISEVLLRHASDVGADMLVIGAYGHSRLRESILGGATRDLL
ncbi:MAG: universal stress protein, partial [Paracoccaceae bacterium]